MRLADILSASHYLGGPQAQIAAGTALVTTSWLIGTFGEFGMAVIRGSAKGVERGYGLAVAR
jgi:hypothetical protein